MGGSWMTKGGGGGVSPGLGISGSRRLTTRRDAMDRSPEISTQLDSRESAHLTLGEKNIPPPSHESFLNLGVRELSTQYSVSALSTL
jgi:hypothetical protein